MKFTIAAFAAAATVANAQLVFNSGNSTFSCLGDTAGKNFCAGDSLSTNIIIRCNGTVGQPGNCNDNLAGIPPVGVKFAECYQTSNTTGDAACSYNGTVYPDSGSSYPIPSGTASSSSSATATATSLPVYTSASVTSSSSLKTVTGTVTITTCTLSSYTAAGTGGSAHPTTNGTITTGLPIPTANSGAYALGAQAGLVTGVFALIAAMML